MIKYLFDWEIRYKMIYDEIRQFMLNDEEMSALIMWLNTFSTEKLDTKEIWQNGIRYIIAWWFSQALAILYQSSSNH